MMYFALYMIPGMLWFILRELKCRSEKSFLKYPLLVFLFALTYPIIFLLNYLSFIRMQNYLKPFKKWEFILFTKVILIDANKNNP